MFRCIKKRYSKKSMYKKLLNVLKLILFIKILTHSLAHAEFKKINYDIIFFPDHLLLKMCTIDQASDSTEIKLPQLFFTNAYKNVFTVETYIGNIKNILNPEYDYILLHHNAGDKICIQYKLDSMSSQGKHLFDIEQENFFFITEYVLALVEYKGQAQINFLFHNYDQPIISSLNINSSFNQSFSIVDKYNNLVKSFFISNYQSVKLVENDYIFFPSDFTQDFSKNLISYLRSITLLCKEFFLINNQRSFVTNNSFIFVNSKDKNTNSGIAQKAMNSSYQVIATSNNSNLDDQLKHTILHEYLHQWFGLTFKPQSINDSRWFFEGVTDYYAAKLNYIFNQFDCDSFFKIFNNKLQNYYYNNFDKISLTESNVGMPIYDLIDYDLGFILGSLIDNKISFHNPQYNLDFFVKSLVDKEPIFVKEKFFSDIENVIQLDLAQFVNKALSSNRTLYKILPKTICIHNNNACRTLTLIEDKTPNYGFNLLKSLKNFEMIEVQINSLAYNLGLREKQFIKEFTQNPQDKTISIGIDYDNGKIKTFNIHPVYKKIKLPQYILQRVSQE
ncbi:MAG: hypothetical protein EKK61_06030 [Rickettsiales bacterium]|nr:MAG: hypothetical protein EKK61_06030 [Rickettsiales bacterium]